MEIIKAIDLILQNIIVRWALLVLSVLLIVTAVIQKASITTLGLELKAAKESIAEYTVAAKESEKQRQELESKVNQAAAATEQIKKDYDARLDKLNKTKITSTTCSGMIAESLRILQGGQ